MTRRVRFRPEVEGDLVGALEWYEGRCVGLGDEFLRAFDAAVALVTRNPAASCKVHGRFRRRLLRRFPYALYYLADPTDIVVFGLFHCARAPRELRKTLRGRTDR